MAEYVIGNEYLFYGRIPVTFIGELGVHYIFQGDSIQFHLSKTAYNHVKRKFKFITP